MKVLVVIPARGGSKGIPRKNVRFMAGKPLISYAIQCARNCSFQPEVVVTSDDEEIQNISQKYGAEIVLRPAELGGDKVTLDPVIYHATLVMEQKRGYSYDVVITMQPTSPLLSVETLNSAIDYFVDGQYDTVLSGVNEPRLSWRMEDGKCVPNYKERLNRQYMPKDLKETGAFVITKREFVTEKSRFGQKISIYELPEREAGDIDTPQDWWIAEKELEKKNIVIRVDGYAEIGMGHIYRGLLLGSNFIDHNVLFVLSKKSDIGKKKMEESHYPFVVIENDEEFFQLLKDRNADIVINDILNTDKAYVEKIKELGVRVVNFEDLGEGSSVADATINALYEPQNSFENVAWGSDYFMIRDEFILEEPSVFSEEVQEVMVLFGGTDPNNLTYKTVNALKKIVQKSNTHVTIILGLGYGNEEQLLQALGEDEHFTVVRNVKMMSSYMKRADLAISSQGRTMLELAAMGVPTILMSQNSREATHEFGTMANGFLNLGNGKYVEEKTIEETLQWLINCPQIRQSMHEQMCKQNLRSGVDRVKKIILGE